MGSREVSNRKTEVFKRSLHKIRSWSVMISEGKDVGAMKGALENYTITQKGNQTELNIDSDTFLEMKGFFLDTWPKALEKLKRICEE